MDYAGFLRALIKNPPDANEAMRRLSHYVIEHDESADRSLWTSVREIDWTPHAARVASWFTEGMQDLANHPEVHLLSISLGDLPEVFSFEGLPLAEGQPAVDRILRQMAEDDWSWFDALGPAEWDESVELSVHGAEELPGPSACSRPARPATPSGKRWPRSDRFTR